MKRILLLLPVLAVVMTACSSPVQPTSQELPLMWWADLGKPCPMDAPAPSLPDSLRVHWTSARPNRNDRWADIARRIPGGWGGSFIDDGRWTMYLTDPTQAESAVDALRAEGVPVGYGYVVEQGHWDFAQMYDWYRYLSPHVQAVEGVTFSDIQEARNRLEYGVVDDDVRAELEGVLSALDVPCHLVAIKRTGRWILNS